MLYEFNEKFYVKPFSNKLVEVDIEKANDGLQLVPTSKIIFLTPEIQKKLVQVTIEHAYEKISKSHKISMGGNI